MPRYIVPMFLDIEAPDSDAASDIAGELQHLALTRGLFLYQDEGLKNGAIPGDCEPHTVLDHCEPCAVAVLEEVK